jgi:hypothetical protein
MEKLMKAALTTVVERVDWMELTTVVERVDWSELTTVVERVDWLELTTVVERGIGMGIELGMGWVKKLGL